MMNKGLEVIEASYLFALTPDEIDRPSCIRSRSSMAWSNFSDRSVVAQLGAPDMRHADSRIAWGGPDRIKGPAARLDLAKVRPTDFLRPPISNRFSGASGWPIHALADRPGGAHHGLQCGQRGSRVAAFIAGADQIRCDRPAGRGDDGGPGSAPAIWLP